MPFALAVGAGRGGLDIFLSFLFPSLGVRPIQTEILFQRAIKPKTTNQPNVSYQVLTRLIHDNQTYLVKMVFSTEAFGTLTANIRPVTTVNS